MDDTTTAHMDQLARHRGPRPKSPCSLERIRVKNRRKRYLDVHPEYFSPSLELAAPLLYDRMIRRFQTPAERESEGRSKGYSGILEADLWRSEAKMEALRQPDSSTKMTYRHGPHGEILAENPDEVPLDKEDGKKRWREAMELRFLKGDDGDFNYREVDESEEYDDRGLEEREEQERYFAEEEPKWVLDHDVIDKDHDTTRLKGQTGIQDY